MDSTCMSSSHPAYRSIQDYIDLFTGTEKKNYGNVQKMLLESKLPLPSSLEGWKVGIPMECQVEEMEKDIQNAWKDCILQLQEGGAEIVPISIQSLPLALPA